MKTTACLDAINNGYARLTYGEGGREQIDVRLTTLSKYIPEKLEEGEILELTISDSKEVVDAQRLVEETERRRRRLKALIDWLAYGIYSDGLGELNKENV